MKRLILPLVVLGLAACQQPADEPDNPAVDTTPMEDTGTAQGANSFTEDQARGAIESAGYTNVTGLTQDPQGVWRGTATREGESTQVSVDYRGSVTPGDSPAAGPDSDMGEAAPTQP